MNNTWDETIFFFIGLIITLGLAYLIVSFIAWDWLWFIHSLAGRIIAMVLFLTIFAANIKAMNE